MRSSTITFTCDLCGNTKSVKGGDMPNKWMRVVCKTKEKELCPKCIEQVKYNITLDEAKKMVEGKTPRPPERPHPLECRCQACCYD